MSDAQTSPGHEGPHEGPIRTPKQLILAVLFSFVVPVIVILLLVEYVTSHSRPAAGSEAFTAADLEARIRPVGMVEVKDASDLSTLKTGEQVFNGQCAACHVAGVVGAPKFGDAAAWAPRIATGYDALLHSALAGKGNMSPQAGGDYTNFEIGRAVVYMTNKAGGRLEEPKPPTAGASAADAMPMAAAPDAVPQTTATAATPAPAAVAAAESPPAATTASADATSPVAVAAVPVLYTQVCQVCHAAGIAGAPKFGDKAAWAPRIAETGGVDGLTAIAIKGKGAMPPRGGSTASDADIKTVVAYMVSAVK